MEKSSKSSISLDTGHTGLPGKPVRLLLGRAASEALTSTGEKAFVLIGKASYPDEPGRWAIHIVPCEIETANAASRVALGTHKATKKGGKGD